MSQTLLTHRLAKPILLLLGLVPLGFLIWKGLNDHLGTNPVETINRYTGDWVLRFLLITLAVTPLRRMFGWNRLLRFRRLFGLFAFFYATLHFLSYVWLDQFFAIDAIIKDVAKRLYITVGFTCFVLLIPLAATSTNGMIRRLGARRWQQLHRLVYFIAIGGIVHYLWLVKSDLAQPLIYGAILGVLLGFRLWGKTRRAPVPAAAGGSS